MIGIRRGAVATDSGQRRGAAPLRVLQGFDYEQSRAFAHDEAVSVPIEGARGRLGRIVTHRDSVHHVETRHGDAHDSRPLATRHHYVGGAAPDVLGEARGTNPGDGSEIAREVFKGLPAIGEDIRLNGIRFTVIGVLRPKGQSPSGRDQDDFVFVPLSTAKQRLLGARRAGCG